MTSEPNPVRIVVADGQRSFREDVLRPLESENRIHVLKQVADPLQAVKAASELKPAVLLIDLDLARQVEFKVTSGFARSLTPIRIVAMVRVIEKTCIIEAFRIGVHGLVLKSSSPEILFQSIQRVISGYYWVESASVGILVEALRESLATHNGVRSTKDYGLTHRELEIIAKIASGRSNREVGQAFSISERTVKHHLTNIFTKTGVSSRLQLALFAVDHHLMRDQTVHVGTAVSAEDEL